MTTAEGFDRKGDEEQGYWDAYHGFPRASTRPYYRAGYDRGLSDVLGNRVPEVPENQS